MGVVNAEVWNNLGLCCFHAGQYDTTLSCFERALGLADNGSLPDVWYNIGQARAYTRSVCVWRTAAYGRVRPS